MPVIESFNDKVTLKRWTAFDQTADITSTQSAEKYKNTKRKT